MLINTTRFGQIEAADDETIVFPDGIPGFSGRREMLAITGGDLLGAEPNDGHPGLFWLQDVNDPDLAFLTTVPWPTYPDYDVDPDLDPEVFSETQPDDVCVLAIVTVRRNGEEVVLTANLLAPIVIDQRRRVGKQVIIENGDWPVRAPLAQSRSVGANQC